MVKIAETKIVQNITGYSLIDRTRNEEIREICEVQNVVRRIKEPGGQIGQPQKEEWEKQNQQNNKRHQTQHKKTKRKSAKKLNCQLDILVSGNARLKKQKQVY